jgi:hypothetical protein
MKRHLFLAAVILAFSSRARGDEPLGPPRVLGPEAPPPVLLYPPPPPIRASYYSVWHYYGVNGAGHFVPLVLDTPRGAYYAYRGIPYPWLANHNRLYMPYAQD